VDRWCVSEAPSDLAALGQPPPDYVQGREALFFSPPVLPGEMSRYETEGACFSVHSREEQTSKPVPIHASPTCYVPSLHPTRLPASSPHPAIIRSAGLQMPDARVQSVWHLASDFWHPYRELAMGLEPMTKSLAVARG
jgi:hypothetical protein